MRTLIKIIVVIVILAIAALIAIPFLIDPNDYKEEISQQVEKATGRQLIIQGDIGLSVFPWVALQLGQLSLSNAEGFEADHFASVNSAQIRIKLMPLLKREVEMDTIVLDGLMLNLETNEAGQTNWDDLTQSKAEVEMETSQSSAVKDDATPALAALSIAGVKLTNANILWSDASKGDNYQIRNLNLDTDAIVPGTPSDVKLNFDLISANPEMRSHINLTTQISVDVEKQLYSLEKLRLSTLAQSQSLPFSQANIILDTDIVANMMNEVITLRNMTLDGTVNTLNDQSLAFKLSSRVDANLGAKQYQLKDLALSGKVKDPNMPGGETDFSLTSNITANLEAQTLTMTDLALHIEDLLLSGQVNTSELLSETPKFGGTMQIEPFNLRKLLTKLNVELPEMADASTLELFALSTAFEGSSEQLNTNSLKMTLDQSHLTGKFGIRNFSQPALTFDLALDQIDADRYLPAAEEKQTQDKIASPATATASAATEFPLETLRKINAKGVFKLGKLKVSGIRSENIVITLDAKEGLIKMSPLAADLYEGEYRGNVNVDARGDKLKLSINERLQGIQAGPLLTDLTGDAKISGSANASVTLSGEGIDVDAIKNTLNGQGNFSFENGAVKGVNIAETLRRARAAMTGQSLPESTAPVATDFSALNGSFTVIKGVINNNDLSMMSPLLRLNGAGTIDLPDEKLDYSLRVAIVGSLEGEGGRGLEDLRGLTIPVRISGSFDDPKPSVDLATLFREQATDQVREKAEEKIREQLGDNIGGLLGGALGGNHSTSPAEEELEQTDDAEPAGEQKTPSAEEQLKEDAKNRLRSLF